MSKDKKIIEDLEKAGAASGAETEVRGKFFHYFRKNKSKIPLGQRVETLYVWLTTGRFAGKDKLVLIGSLLYFLNPFDVIPDITPFIGFFDDIGIIGLTYRYLQNRALEETNKRK